MSGIPVLDIWTFEGRSRIYESLIESSRLPWSNQDSKSSYTTLSLANIETWSAHSGNLLWGLALQFVWQFQSGRHYCVQDPETLLHAIPPTAWWSSMNTCHSVVPWLVAQSLNLGSLKGQGLDNSYVRRSCHPLPARFPVSTRGPFTSATHETMFTRWHTYFSEVARLQALSISEFHSQEDDIRPQLAHLLWEAHASGLRYGLEVFEPELRCQSQPEVEMGVGFCNTVIGLKANYIETTSPAGILQLNRTILPQRVLTSFEMEKAFSDLPIQQQKFVSATRKVGRRVLTGRYGAALRTPLDALTALESSGFAKSISKL